MQKRSFTEKFAFLSLDEIEKILDGYLKKDITSIYITGGEPTLHKNIFSIIEMVKKKGFSKVCIITNGILLKDKNFVSKLKKSGIDEIIFSVHGSTSKIHDSLTCCNGSFYSVMSGIKNVIFENISFSINFVLVKTNYKDSFSFSKFITKYSPRIVTFLYSNTMNEAKNQYSKQGFRYFDSLPYIKKAINYLEENNITTDVKFVPICLFKGYEKNIADKSFAIYDYNEWNYKKRYLISTGYLRYVLALFNYFYLFYPVIFKVPFDVLSYHVLVKKNDESFFIKLPSCRKCKYDLICEGILKSQAQYFGVDDFRPVFGKKRIYNFKKSPHVFTMNSYDYIANTFFFLISIFSYPVYKTISFLKTKKHEIK